MRVTRAKQYRKHLRFFRIVYNIKAPYKVILDGNFIHGCLSMNVNIEERLASVLQGAPLRLFVPRAALEELEALGGAFQKAYKFAVGRCRELPAPKNAPPGDGEGGSAGEGGRASYDDPASEILATIGSDNAEKYLVASQDEELRVQLRRIPGCPLLFVSRTVLVMEQPSGKSKAEVQKAERKHGAGTTEEEGKLLGAIKQREREELQRERASQPRKRLKKRASAPNPLSCKRPKTEARGSAGSGGRAAAVAGTASDGGSSSRRRRRRGSSGPDSRAVEGVAGREGSREA